MASPKPVIEFAVVHKPHEVKFRVNADTRISKVWDTYAKSRKWLPSEQAKYRLFKDQHECLGLSGTVQSNQITDGSRLQVYELCEEEKCAVTFCDQSGMHNSFDAFIEDDLLYWVDAFRTWAWNAQGMPSASQALEWFTIYDCASHKKVNLKKGSRPVTLDLFVQDVAHEDGTYVSRAIFLCFRSMPQPRPDPMTVSFWIWDGENISIDVDAGTPLQEAVKACTVMLFGPVEAPLLLTSPERVVLYKSGAELDTPRLNAGMLRSRVPGGPGSDSEAASDDASPGSGGGGCASFKSVDVDYLLDVGPGGALQVAALRDCAAGHPALVMLPPKAFSDQSAGPLYLAASRGHVKSVAALLKWGADPGAGNSGLADSAEFTAALHGHEAVVRLMLQHGLGTVARGHTAAAMGKRLQQAARGSGGSRALTLGCYCACQSTCQRRITLLTSPSETERKLMAALSTVAMIAAAERGHVGVVQSLLDAGYPADVQESTGESALSVAAANGHAAVVKALLAAGASPHHRSLDGETPLHSAALSGNAECVQMLLEARADPNALSDLLLPYDEVTRISSRNFRNPLELGEWFRRQPRSSRMIMMEHAAIQGGCSPLSLAVGLGWQGAALLLLDATGCTGKEPVPKARAELLQHLLSLASSGSDTAMASLLLGRLQACGQSSSAALPEPNVSAAEGHRMATAAGFRSRKAIHTAIVPRTGRRGGADGDAGGWDAAADAGNGVFDTPADLLRAGAGSQTSLSSEQLQPPPSSLMLPNQYMGRGGVGADADRSADGRVETEKAARKVRARAARAAQAAEAAVQQEQRRQEQKRQQQQEQRQQQLLAKKQMQREQQQKQRPEEARLAENAGVEHREYILQERLQLRKKLGLDQGSDAVGGAADAAAPAASQSAAPEVTSTDATGCGAPVDLNCRCCLRDDAMDIRVAAATAAPSSGPSPASGVADGEAAGVVRCQVDPEHAAVGLRQRWLVVYCSSGCQLDYHYPECWRELEALLKTARPDYHGLKGPGGRSHAVEISCWSRHCTGVIQAAFIMEGPTEQPRFRQQLYGAPNMTQQQQHVGKGGKGKAGRAQPPANTAADDNAATKKAAEAQIRKADRQKEWQQQSWYDQYEGYNETGAEGHEVQEGDEDPSMLEVDQEEENQGPRASEVVDLSTVKLVPLSRRQAMEGLELEIEGPVVTKVSSPDGAETTASLDGVEAAPLVEGGGTASGSSKARAKRGGGVKLTLTELHVKESATESGSPSDGSRKDRQMAHQQQQPQSWHPAGSVWRDSASLPFAVRPVWEGGEAGNGSRGGSELATSDQAQAVRPSVHQAVISTMTGAPHLADGGKAPPKAPRPEMTEEEFPSLTPVNLAEEEKAAAAAARDPIVRALQLLKVPGTDILTPHLLLEGPCLRHFYTVLFRGRPNIADTQLSAALDRYGGVTAFQSFEGGTAVAVSYRSEENASAVAAGLGAGDVQGLLGPGSLAGAGGLEVSCLLEFPTDDALAREMGQAEQAAGGFASSRGCSSCSAPGSRLKADAIPFVPRACTAATKSALPPPHPPPAVGAPLALAAARPLASAAATATVLAVQRRMLGIFPHKPTDDMARASLAASPGNENCMNIGNGTAVDAAASEPGKSRMTASDAGGWDYQAEDAWATASVTVYPGDPWSDGNLPPVAGEMATSLTASSAESSAPLPRVLKGVTPVSAPLPSAPVPASIATALMAAPVPVPAAAIVPVPILAAAIPLSIAAAQVPSGPACLMAVSTSSPPYQGHLTGGCRPVSGVHEPLAPVVTAMVARSSAPSQQHAHTAGPGPALPLVIGHHAMQGSFAVNLLLQQPLPRQEMLESLVPLSVYEEPSGIIAPTSTPSTAGPQASLQAPAQSTLVQATPPPTVNVTAAPPSNPALTPTTGLSHVHVHAHSHADTQASVDMRQRALLLTMPWLAARPTAIPAAPAGPRVTAANLPVPMGTPGQASAAAGFPAVSPSSSYTVVAPQDSHSATLQGFFPAVAPGGAAAGYSVAEVDASQMCRGPSAAPDGVQNNDEVETDILLDVLGLCLG